MWRVLLVYVVPLALTIYALVDCIQTDESETRGLPKPFWVLIILFGWLPGSIAWLVAGRPRRGPAGAPRPPARATAPDDDPEFLARLREQRLKKWEAELRRREEELRKERPEGEDPDKR